MGPLRPKQLLHLHLPRHPRLSRKKTICLFLQLQGRYADEKDAVKRLQATPRTERAMGKAQFADITHLRYVSIPSLEPHHPNVFATAYLSGG